MYYDYSKNTLSSEFNENSVADFYSKFIESGEKCIDLISDKLKNRVPFSLVRIGDVEARFLIRNKTIGDSTVDNILWWCGIDKNNIPRSDELMAAVEEATFLGVHDPRINRSPNFWGPTLDMLALNNILGNKPLYEVHAIYKYAGSGRLFQDLWDRDVVLVGGKMVYYQNYFHTNKAFRSLHPDLKLERINIVNTIPTPDIPNFAMSNLDEIKKRVRNSYRNKDAVFLFSCGAAAKILSTMVKREANLIGMDVGNIFETIMNFACKRPFMDRFYDKPHPTFHFDIDPNTTAVTRVRAR